MTLQFPPLNGGTVSGLNDAGIETFEGDFAKNVVRECTQNSLDAATGQPGGVQVHISRLSLAPGDLPFLSDLKKVLQSCRDYWKDHDKALKFFTDALNTITRPQIDAVKISDFGTTGVDGSDDDKTGRWFGLVKSRGVSNRKGADSGGAFGIGKDAPLAGSVFRTVIYSTRTVDGQVALQGVCRLVTHNGGDGEPTQGTGFIGEYDSTSKVYRAIRDSSKIPSQFLRQEPGLDVWILGSRHSTNDWAKPFVCSALANFWPAIADEKVVFKVGEDVIDSSNLSFAMRTERFDEHVADSWPFYQSLVDQHAKRFEKKLPIAGECRLHMLSGHRDLPKRICMVRRTGMVIEQYAPRVGFLPFVGLFVCDSSKGNELLRSLEPPRHDKWDPERSDEPTAAQALKEIKEWIREVIKKQVPHSGEDQFNESEVPPDLLEDPPENPITDSNAESESDLGGNPKDITLPEKVKVRTHILQKKSALGRKGIKLGSDDVDDPKQGDGKSTGGRKSRHDDGDGDSTLTPKVPNLSARAFTPNSSDEATELILRTDGAYEGSVWIEGLGDDGGAEKLKLESAEVVGIGPVEIEHGKIRRISLSPDEIVRIKLQFSQPGKYSVRATLS